MRRIDSCGHKAWTSSDPAEFKGRSKASNFGELRDGLISGKFWERRRWQPVEAPPGNIMSGGEPRCSARFAGAHSPGGSRSIATASSMCSGPSVPSMVGTSEADYARTQRQSRPSGSPSEAAGERLSPDCLHRRRHRGCGRESGCYPDRMQTSIQTHLMHRSYVGRTPQSCVLPAAPLAP